MSIKKHLIASSILALAVIASPSFASSTIWDFTTGSSSSSYGNGNFDGNQLNFNEGTSSVTVTAWADTQEVYGPDLVENATAAQNYWGLLNYNRNSGDGHYVDNAGDSDMLLLSFDSSVAISGIQLGWFSNDSDISIAAFSTLPTLAGNTWAQVASNALFSASFANIGTSAFSMSNMLGGSVVEAQYWLVGAFNSVFGSASGAGGGYHDYIKIASITTDPKTPSSKPPQEVAEPSTLAILTSFGLFAMWRRSKNV